MQHYRALKRWCCIFLYGVFRKDATKDANGYDWDQVVLPINPNKAAKDPKGFLEEYQERKKKSGSISRVL